MIRSNEIFHKLMDLPLQKATMVNIEKFSIDLENFLDARLHIVSVKIDPKTFSDTGLLHVLDRTANGVWDEFRYNPHEPIQDRRFRFVRDIQQ